MPVNAYNGREKKVSHQQSKQHTGKSLYLVFTAFKTCDNLIDFFIPFQFCQKQRHQVNSNTADTALT